MTKLLIILLMMIVILLQTATINRLTTRLASSEAVASNAWVCKADLDYANGFIKAEKTLINQLRSKKS